LARHEKPQNLPSSTPGSSEPFSAMRRQEILRWADRNNPGGIDIVVSEIVMTFNVIEVHRIGNAIDLVEIA
jgi:hypothetical protein